MGGIFEWQIMSGHQDNGDGGERVNRRGAEVKEVLQNSDLGELL